MRCGAFVDRSRIPQYTEQDFNLPENPPFSWLLRKTKTEAENKTDDEKLSKSNDENSSPNNLNSRIAEASKLSQSPKDTTGTSPSSFKSRWSVRENKEDDKLLKELVSCIVSCLTAILLIWLHFPAFPLRQPEPDRGSREILPRVLQRASPRVLHHRHRSHLRSSGSPRHGGRADATARRVRDVAEPIRRAYHVAGMRFREPERQLNPRDRSVDSKSIRSLNV